jgi:hypothetical protein
MGEANMARFAVVYLGYGGKPIAFDESEIVEVSEDKIP